MDSGCCQSLGVPILDLGTSRFDLSDARSSLGPIAHAHSVLVGKESLARGLVVVVIDAYFLG